MLCGGLRLIGPAGEAQHLGQVEQDVGVQHDEFAVGGDRDPLARQPLGLLEASAPGKQARRDARALDQPLAVGRRRVLVDRPEQRERDLALGSQDPLGHNAWLYGCDVEAEL